MDQLPILIIILGGLVNITTIIGLHVRTQARLVRLETEIRYVIKQFDKG